jgi:hypothetical protein
MTNVYTLKNNNDESNSFFRGVSQRLGGAYEQELKEKLYSALKSKAKINDFSEKLVAKYLEREEEFQQIYANIENKINQMNESNTKIRSQLISERRSYSDEINLLKSNIKTLERKTTLAQKASSIDKITILSLEAKIGKLEGKLINSIPYPSFYDSILAKKIIEVTNKQDKQKLPDWVNSNLKSLVYKLSLENKAWEIDKKYNY